MNREQLLAKIAAMKTAPAQVTPEPTPTPAAATTTPTPADEIPATLKKLLGIVETIEESTDRTPAALIQAAGQVERCRAYITYLRSILPILEAKAEAMINAAHQPAPIQIPNTPNFNLN